MKQLEDNDSPLKGQIVRVDDVILPPWAVNRHHFISMNYLALEHPKTKSKINNWIDLIFGEKQQKPEFFNLFKPLTSEKHVKEREDNPDTKLEASDVNQIVEFGQNPSQIFEKLHPLIEEKSLEGLKVVFDVLNDPQLYTVIQYKQKDVDPYSVIRVIVKDRQNITVINNDNKMVKKQLIGGKNEYKTAGQPGLVCWYFSIYNATKEKFTVDPLSVFTTNSDHLVVCRNNDNTFMVYSLNSLGILFAVPFHKTIVNAVHIDDDLLYTGDIDGMLAVWKLPDLLHSPGVPKRPKHFMTDHYDAIISIDSNYELDLYVTASKTSCVLRVASTDRYLLTITPDLSLKVKYKVFKVLLSARGYLIIQARSAFKTYEKDMLLVYSINGEKVAQKELDESVNAILFDPHHYFIITGGNGRKLKRYSVIGLEEENLHDYVEGLSVFPATITTLTYIPGGKTTLLIGLANSQMYVVDFMPPKSETATDKGYY